MKNGRKTLFVVLLSYLFIDAVSSSNRSDYTHKQQTSPYWLTNGKKTKTYGLVGLNAPLRQGRSLSLPTLPYQQTNRYAVVGNIAIHSLSNLVQKASPLIPNTRIIVSSCILILLKTYGILSRSHIILYEFEIRNNL